jgi:hypothetical protein
MHCCAISDLCVEGHDSTLKFNVQQTLKIEPICILETSVPHTRFMLPQFRRTDPKSGIDCVPVRSIIRLLHRHRG